MFKKTILQNATENYELDDITFDVQQNLSAPPKNDLFLSNIYRIRWKKYAYMFVMTRQRIWFIKSIFMSEYVFYWRTRWQTALK